MLYIIYGALSVGGYVTIISSAITLIIALFSKEGFSAIKGPLIALAVGIVSVLLSSLILKFV